MINQTLRVLCCFLATTLSFHHLQGKEKPDIVLIVVDDLNDWIGAMGGHPNTKTPNIDSLAAKGMLFPQAYCNAPQCRPSRLSMNHGIYPFNSGTYFNAKSKNESKPKTPTIQKFFMENGYRVASGGKVHHGGPGKDGDALRIKPNDPLAPWGKKKYDVKSNPPNDGHVLDVKTEEMGDFKVASWAIDQWQSSSSEKPLFMSVGFYRPHRPLQVPKMYFDRFPLKSIKRPAEPKEDDWDDMPEFARKLARTHAHKSYHNGMSDHEFILSKNDWDFTIQAYLASVNFVDEQIGRLLKALEKNPRGRETYIVLVSDHGWHLGEKKHWCKGAIWEQTTRIPFIVKGPNIKAGTICKQPVSLIDVFPSLVDIAGIKVPEYLDGKSALPQLKDPNIKRSPAIISYGAKNTAIRSERWRYIRYEDGSEELYDHSLDPNEWKNLADDFQYNEIKKELSTYIPKNQLPSLKVADWFDLTKKKKRKVNK